jgi:uncharacterized protein (TIGR02246 family)
MLNKGPLGCLVLGLACATAKPDASTKVRSPAVAVVQTQLDAYNKQDLEAFVNTYANDVVVTAGGKVVVQGKEALRERYQKLFAKYPRNHAEIAERRAEGENVVVDHEIITGRSPDKPDPWDVGWVRYEVANGLIKTVQLP